MKCKTIYIIFAILECTKTYTIETTLEFTPDIKDAIEVSIKVA